MTTETTGMPEFAIVREGDVRDHDVDHAIERVRSLLEKVDEPILFARLKFTHLPDSGRALPALAQATIDINGDVVRAQTAGETVRHATDELRERLRSQLEQRSHRRQIGRGETLPRWQETRRPEYIELPPEERELVRRKTFPVGAMTPEEAAFDMEQLDHDFYLFVDLDSGLDAVVRRGEGEYRVHFAGPTPDNPPPGFVFTDVTPTEMSVEDAIQRIETTGQRNLFFVNTETGRGNVLYQRYDGHYGLITPE